MMSDSDKISALAETIAEYSFINKQLRTQLESTMKEMEGIRKENQEMTMKLQRFSNTVDSFAERQDGDILRNQQMLNQQGPIRIR